MAFPSPTLHPLLQGVNGSVVAFLRPRAALMRAVVSERLDTSSDVRDGALEPSDTTVWRDIRMGNHPTMQIISI